MATLSGDTLLERLRWRCAVKQFDPSRRIPRSDWEALEAALVLTPSSFGLQPWRFLVITDGTLREALRPLSWNQPQVVDCSHFVVFARKTDLSEADLDRHIDRIAAVRHVPAASQKAYRDRMAGSLLRGPARAAVPEWTARQVYIALGNLLTSAAVLGIDACPMEGIEPAKYDAALALAGTGYSTVVACALGYRKTSDPYAAQAKVRFPASEVIEHR